MPFYYELLASPPDTIDTARARQDHNVFAYPRPRPPRSYLQRSVTANFEMVIFKNIKLFLKITAQLFLKTTGRDWFCVAQLMPI